MKTPKVTLQRLMASVLVAATTAAPAQSRLTKPRSVPVGGGPPGKSDTLQRTAPWNRGAQAWARALHLPPESSVAPLQRILQSPQWSTLSTAQKTQVARIVARSTVDGLGSLAMLMEKPGIFQQRDSTGHSLLMRLDQLATEKMDPRLTKQVQQRFLPDTMEEIADPRHISQELSTCATTSPEHALAEQYPAELVRLEAGLAQGQVQLGPHRMPLQVEAMSYRGEQASRSQAAVQWSLWKEAHAITPYYRGGGLQLIVEGKPVSRTHEFLSENDGLDDEQQERLYSRLFPGPYVVQERGPTTMLEQLGQAVQLEVKQPIFLDLGNGSGHAVQFRGIREGRVWYWDPTAHPNVKVGEKLADGSRREDPIDSLFSLGEAEFSARVRAVVIPADIPEIRAEYVLVTKR